MVLLVEDFARTVRTIRRALHGRWELYPLGTVAEVRLLSERSAPSAALVDIILPDGSGLDVVRWLRERWPCLPIAVVTGMLDADVINEISTLSVSLIAKPLDLAPIVSFLERSERARQRTNLDDVFDMAKTRLALSDREFQIVRWVEAGNALQAFAVTEGISVDTVKDYVRRLLAKTGAASVESLVISVLRDAWLSDVGCAS
jgi:DNA-binding NarL/FixJ family response regulator